jgi:hypothetical protein
MSKVKEFLFNRAAEILLSALVVAVLGIYNLYKEDLVNLVYSTAPKSLYMLGWLFVILLSFLIASLILLVHQKRKNRDPYKGFVIDSVNRTAFDPKTKRYYCTSCLGHGKRFLKNKESENWWKCSNQDCQDSHPPAAVSGIKPEDSPDAPKNPIDPNDPNDPFDRGGPRHRRSF